MKEMWLPMWQLPYAIDDHRRLETMMAVDGPTYVKSWADALSHTDDWNNDRLCDIWATGMDNRRIMGSEVEIWWRNHLRWFLISLSTCSHLGIWTQYRWCWHGFWPSVSGSAVMPRSGSAERSALSCTNQLSDVWVWTLANTGWYLCSLFPFLLVSALNPGLVHRASVQVFITFWVNRVEVDFRHAPRPPKGGPESSRSVVGRMMLYEYIRGMIE